MRSLLLVAAVLGYSPIAAADPDDDRVARLIRSQAQRLGGSEYAAAREVQRTGARDNGAIAVAVLYTIEGIGGGNNHSRYLVAFLNAGKAPAIATRPLLVGEKGYRAVQLDQVESRAIRSKTRSYKRGDAMCCPSLEGISWYRLTDGSLAEGPGLLFEP